MTVEDIAQAVVNLRRHAVAFAFTDDADNWRAHAGLSVDAPGAFESKTPIVDITRPWRNHPSHWDLREFDLHPAWQSALICCEQDDGPIMMNYIKVERIGLTGSDFPASFPDELKPRASWLIIVYPFIGLRSFVEGPHSFGFIVVDVNGGSLGHYYQAPPFPMAGDQMEIVRRNESQAVGQVGAALNFSNMLNTVVVEPKRTADEVKRLRRLAPGVTICEIVLERDLVRVRRGFQDERYVGRPLETFRGTYRCYGPTCCPEHVASGMSNRGRLFGKLSGRWWWEERTVGSGEFGEIRKNYTLGGDS